MTTWLHITSSYTWTRPAVGVIRVEQKLFAALASQNLHDPVENDLRYCIFMGGEFFEVPASAMEIKPQNPDEVARPGLVMGMLWAFWLAVRALWLRLAAISPVAARAFQKAKALRNRRQQIKDGHQPWPVALK